MLVFGLLSFIANEVENLIARGCSVQEAEMYRCTEETFEERKRRGGEMFGAEMLLILK